MINETQVAEIPRKAHLNTLPSFARQRVCSTELAFSSPRARNPRRHSFPEVSAPAYDSVRGEHLLIPQGSRLIGTYDNGMRYGDHRILLVWNRLILPNGWSINLQDMPASDGAGQSGVQDRTDYHFGRLTAAVGLSAIISVIANESEDDEEESSSMSQSVGDAAASQAASTGGRLVDRELAVRPTLRVRAGAPVRVLVTRDIELRPYAGVR